MAEAFCRFLFVSLFARVAEATRSVLEMYRFDPQAENSAKQEFFLFSGEVFLFDDLNRHILASPQFEGSSSLV